MRGLEKTVKSEIEKRAEFSFIRYAQCWEDADIVLKGLNIEPGDKCLSIAASGDNSLAMLAFDPARVVAIDLNQSQLALLELKAAAFRALEYEEMLQLLGYSPSDERIDLFVKIEHLLSDDARKYWVTNIDTIDRGVAGSGKFENYFRTFRKLILPLVHDKRTIDALLAERGPAQRALFYEKSWNTLRWKMMFKLFFSKPVMGMLGRDPEFFKYAEGNLPANLMHLTRQALVDQDPSKNPYLHWILKGEFGDSLPFFLRRDNFEKIRRNIDCLEIRRNSMEQFLESSCDNEFDSFNLSDIFEYMSTQSFVDCLKNLRRVGKPGARLVYFNMMVDRHSENNVDGIEINRELSQTLFALNKTFFYKRFLVEELVA